MKCQEIMLKVIKRQNEGFMFHDRMADYYQFLHLDSLRDLHEHQAEEELECLRWLKNEYMDEFCQVPFYHAEYPMVIPEDWKSKTSAEITKGAIKTLAKESLSEYLEWEKETLTMYKTCAKELSENMNFHSLKLVKEEICGVEEEIMNIQHLIIEAQSHDYDPEYLKYRYECKKKKKKKDY